MKILLVNDDGIDAVGIRSLVGALSKTHTVWIAAPDRQRSAASMSMMLEQPLRAVPRRVEGAALAYSGINHGPNLGSDTLYSGTCGAAQQAAVLGVQAIAMSLDRRDPAHFETAVACTERMIGIVERHPLPFGMFYNVNVPDLPLAEIKGVRVTGLATVRYSSTYERREDPIGRPYYWVPRGKLPCDPDEDTDYAWMKKGWVTVTPMGFHSEKLDAVDLSAEFGGEA